MKKLLEISHLKKSFGDTEVLKDISMEVNEGEVVAILGPSGFGKSTLIRCFFFYEFFFLFFQCMLERKN